MVAAIRERPILFKPDLVRAFLSNEKTQTRRIIKPQPAYGMDGFTGICRYGQPGNRLWVKEQFTVVSTDGLSASVAYRERIPEGKTLADTDGGLNVIEFDSDEEGLASAQWAYEHIDCERWRPSIHMPRWASRLTLEITEVRAQWLHDITEDDAKAEGVKPWEFNPDQPLTSGERAGDSPYRSGFAYKWDYINEDREGGKYMWKNNPAVWALTLKQIME